MWCTDSIKAHLKEISDVMSASFRIETIGRFSSASMKILHQVLVFGNAKEIYCILHVDAEAKMFTTYMSDTLRWWDFSKLDQDVFETSKYAVQKIFFFASRATIL